MTPASASTGMTPATRPRMSSFCVTVPAMIAAVTTLLVALILQDKLVHHPAARAANLILPASRTSAS